MSFLISACPNTRVYRRAVLRSAARGRNRERNFKITPPGLERYVLRCYESFKREANESSRKSKILSCSFDNSIDPLIES